MSVVAVWFGCHPRRSAQMGAVQCPVAVDRWCSYGRASARGGPDGKNEFAIVDNRAVIHNWLVTEAFFVQLDTVVPGPPPSLEVDGQSDARQRVEASGV